MFAKWTITAPSKQYGLSLLEALISLAILALIGLVASSSLSKASLLRDKIQLQQAKLEHTLALQQLFEADLSHIQSIAITAGECGNIDVCLVVLRSGRPTLNHLSASPNTSLDSHVAKESGWNTEYEYLRYRLTGTQLIRDSKRTLSSAWQSHALPMSVSNFSWQFFQDQAWQNTVAELEPNSFSAPRSIGEPLKAVGISWQTLTGPPLHLRVISP